MPSPLFEEWRTLYDMEPWGDERADYTAGAIVASTQGDSGKVLELARKYMPFLKSPKRKPQTEADMKDTWNAICKKMAESEEEAKD
jgi:hypothetical protein